MRTNTLQTELSGSKFKVMETIIIIIIICNFQGDEWVINKIIVK